MSDTTTVPGDHVVTFYEQERDLIEHVGGHLLAAARSGASLIVIASPAHRLSIETHLRYGGVDLGAGQYTARDAEETLTSITRDGAVDAERFDRVVGGLVTSAAANGPVSMFGEMVDLLWQSGDVSGALHLEEHWNELLARVPSTLICGYRADGNEVGGEAALETVCRLHSEVVRHSSHSTAVRREFSASPEAPGAARRFVGETLVRTGCDMLVDDARLVISELATNAVLHARSTFTVVVDASPGGVRLSVEDTSSVATTRGHEDPLAASGRGLGLVAAIATRWGEERTAHGKVVWAELT